MRVGEHNPPTPSLELRVVPLGKQQNDQNRSISGVPARIPRGTVGEQAHVQSYLVVIFIAQNHKRFLYNYEVAHILAG